MKRALKSDSFSLEGSFFCLPLLLKYSLLCGAERKSCLKDLEDKKKGHTFVSRLREKLSRT